MNQTNKIIEWLQPPGRTITPLQALKKFQCFRLGARAWDISKLGYPIKSKIIVDKKTKKHYAQYFFS